MKYSGLRHLLHATKLIQVRLRKKMRLEKCLHKNDHDIPVVYMNLKFLEKKSNRYILVVVSQARPILKFIGCTIILFHDL